MEPFPNNPFMGMGYEPNIDYQIQHAQQEMQRLSDSVAQMNGWLIDIQGQLNALNHRLNEQGHWVDHLLNTVAGGALPAAGGVAAPAASNTNWHQLQPIQEVVISATTTMDNGQQQQQPTSSVASDDPELNAVCAPHCVCRSMPHTIRRQWHNLEVQATFAETPRSHRPCQLTVRELLSSPNNGRGNRTRVIMPRILRRPVDPRTPRDPRPGASSSALSQALNPKPVIPAGLTIKTICSVTKITAAKIENDGAAEECVVCLEEKDEGQHVRELQCGHQFHPQCVEDWLVRVPTCPICRKPAQNAANSDGAGTSKN